MPHLNYPFLPRPPCQCQNNATMLLKYHFKHRIPLVIHYLTPPVLNCTLVLYRKSRDLAVNLACRCRSTPVSLYHPTQTSPTVYWSRRNFFVQLLFTRFSQHRTAVGALERPERARVAVSTELKTAAGLL